MPGFSYENDFEVALVGSCLDGLKEDITIPTDRAELQAFMETELKGHPNRCPQNAIHFAIFVVDACWFEKGRFQNGIFDWSRGVVPQEFKYYKKMFHQFVDKMDGTHSS